MLQNKTVRFFVEAYQSEGDSTDPNNHDAIETKYDFFEVTEHCFLGMDIDKGEIIYERHTMHRNGVNQICLTYRPHFDSISKDDLELIGE